MKRAIVVASICLVVLLGGCGQSQSLSQNTESDQVFSSEASDSVKSYTENTATLRILDTEKQTESEENVPIEENAVEENNFQEEYYEEPYYEDFNTYNNGGQYFSYSDAYNNDGPSHTMPGWYDGNVETYYNASGHYMSGDWTLDSEGYYHDSEGRYVIGVGVEHMDEMPYGTVVQTGKGEAVVYDYGYGSNVHDFATNW